MRHQLYCELCRMPIAAFDTLKSPITPSQFKPYIPQAYLPTSFGGEYQRWDTFICIRCKRWPFENPQDPTQNYHVGQGGRFGKKEPEKVRVGFTGDPKKDWYHIGTDIEKLVCDKCNYETEYKNIMARHVKSDCKWPARKK